MDTYIATNYGMGRPMQSITIQAWSDQSAVAQATKKLTTPHGLPGSGRGAGRASVVIGVRRA